jgi:hypothetical protein
MRKESHRSTEAQSQEAGQIVIAGRRFRRSILPLARADEWMRGSSPAHDNEFFSVPLWWTFLAQPSTQIFRTRTGVS